MESGDSVCQTRWRFCYHLLGLRRFDNPTLFRQGAGWLKLQGMRGCQTQLSPLLRSLAGATLLLWFVALLLCTAHCTLGTGHGDSEQGSCHSSAPAESDHGDGDPPGPTHHGSKATIACHVLKSALSNGNPAAPAQPEFHLLYTQAPLALALDGTLTEPATPIFRQAWRRDWVFTPEVYLGPAFRAHAPPSLS